MSSQRTLSGLRALTMQHAIAVTAENEDGETLETIILQVLTVAGRVLGQTSTKPVVRIFERERH